MLLSPRLSKPGRFYVVGVILVGIGVVLASIYQLTIEPVGLQWYLLVALTLISGSATVKLPSVSASISISETFVFTAVLLYGPAAGTLTVALDGLVISYWIAKRRHEVFRALFNMSAPAASAWCSSQLFFWLAGVEPLTKAPAASLSDPALLLGNILPALLAFAVTYFALNSSLIAFAISAESRIPAFKIWRENFIWLSLNYFCGASVAALLVTYTRELDLRFVGVTIPLLLLLYVTFKVSMGRVEDANKHVEKVNRMYMSTIETLAMAIDAKDQVTHDHIRRVQRHTLGLAQALGVKDEALLKAIEAAALLHDMGKLAVPEHILNKPGKLTRAEFEKMKEHATVGAEILSSIEFPYPVVPIVKHHHESWDGTGYPSGLRGTDIPVGARILSVVDCFDALTSDRPYRKALSAREAMDIVKSRSGSMYDPLIVKKFDEIHEALDDSAVVESGVSKSICVSEQETAPSVRLPAPHISHDDNRNDLGSSIPDLIFSFADQVLVEQIHLLVSPRAVICFELDRQTNSLKARHFRSESGLVLSAFQVMLGQGVSGWVAAHRQAIVNSEAALDFMSESEAAIGKGACSSFPIEADGTLIGVISIYSHDRLGENELAVLRAMAHDSAGFAMIRSTPPAPVVDLKHRRLGQ